jgi:hypothetical protein
MAPVMVPVQPPRKSSAGLAIWITLGVLGGLALLVICPLVFFYITASQANTAIKNTQATVSTNGYQYTSTAVQATYTTKLTPTPYPYTDSNPPSHSTFSGLAQSILTNAQLASAVNSDYQPTQVSSTFSPNQTIYLTFTVQGGRAGYFYPIWYFNGKSGYPGKVGTIAQGAHGPAYVSISYSGPATAAVELYWCAKSDCSDRLLAWVRSFKVVS